MRLLHTDTLQLVEFMGDYDGQYAILSHTWEKDEISFQEMLLANKNTQPEAEAVKQKAGYRKIRDFATVAAKDGHEYAWVDTCCIDKSSSAELSEAINSMFRWYRNAVHCYVYLADISDNVADNELATLTSRLSLRSRAKDLGLCHSRWFTRGWTLQELVAPVSLRFYLSDWTAGPTRDDLSNQLETIIKIPANVLETGEFSEIPVAERMKWAAKRVTTRVEDMAYCLMGLFDVNMPLLYGEGPKAFLRLQEEIYRNTNDESIFAWTSSSKGWFDDHQYRGLFARSPAEFRIPSVFLHAEPEGFVPPSAPTSLGFNSHFKLLPMRHVLKEDAQDSIKPPPDAIDTKNEYLAILHVWARDPDSRRNPRRVVAIRLKQLSLDGMDRQFARVKPSVLYTWYPDKVPEKFMLRTGLESAYIRQAIRVPKTHISTRWSGFSIRMRSRVWNPPQCRVWAVHTDQTTYCSITDRMEVHCPLGVRRSNKVVGVLTMEKPIPPGQTPRGQKSEPLNLFLTFNQITNAPMVRAQRLVMQPAKFDFRTATNPNATLPGGMGILNLGDDARRWGIWGIGIDATLEWETTPKDEGLMAVLTLEFDYAPQSSQASSSQYSSQYSSSQQSVA